MERVSSLRNPRVALALRLHRKRFRDRFGLFLVEGMRELQRAADAGLVVETLFVREQQSSDQSVLELLAKFRETAETHAVSVGDSVLNAISYRGDSAEAVAIAQTFSLELHQLPTPKNALFLVAAGLEKPGNLGSILRSADAVGATGVIICDQVTDLFNPNVVRSSLGTVFCVQVARTTVQPFVRWCVKHNIALVATSPDAETMYTDFDYRKSTAILIGSELGGLDQSWMEFATEYVRLPQKGFADSLNAAMTANAILFEVIRQRDCASSN